MIKFTIPAIPPSNNKFMGRDARWEYQDFKKLWCSYVSVYCKRKPEAPIYTAKVTLTYYFRDKRRRDPDNYSGKLILDGLVSAGIIADDSFSNIKLELVGRLDRQNPRTEVAIEPVNIDIEKEANCFLCLEKLHETK